MPDHILDHGIYTNLFTFLYLTAYTDITTNLFTTLISNFESIHINRETMTYGLVAPLVKRRDERGWERERRRTLQVLMVTPKRNFEPLITGLTPRYVEAVISLLQVNGLRSDSFLTDTQIFRFRG